MKINKGEQKRGNERDETRIIFKKITDPFFHEFHLKDVLQVLIGASILAIPVGFTKEVWDLGSSLPITNIFSFIILSLLFISLFVGETILFSTFIGLIFIIIGLLVQQKGKKVTK